jgi:phage N-6-adenine-methyltransferase
MSKINSGIMSSNSDEYETPDDLYKHYNKIFNFDGDVCANINNTKHKKNFFDKNDNGLIKDWWKKNWMNPPYGNQISLWVKKAYDESKKNKLVVCLLPARTDTKWWHDYVLKSNHIHFIKGRLRFNNLNSSAPFPSAIVIFGLNYER